MTIGNIVQLREVTVGFPTTGDILSGFNLNVPAKDFLVLYGPSAVGKTTILNLIAGLLSPDSGSICWADRSQFPRIGFHFQNYEETLFPWLSNTANIEAPLRARRNCRITKAERREQVRNTVERLKLHFPLKGYPYQMSGGGKQKIALTRALVGNPDILLLDEPFNSLDINDRQFMQQEIVRIWRELELTIVLVTHDLDEALLVGGTLLILGGRPANIVGSPITIGLPYPRDLSVISSKEYFELRKEVLNRFERAKDDLINRTSKELA